MPLNDENNNFYFTKAGIIVPTVTGSISFLSSLTVVSFILRSRVNNVYHRIIFCMSFFDMLTSLAIALTTIPMPSDVTYPFDGPSYGTVQTCEAQGFIYMLGYGMVVCMNMTLNIYYLCTLRFEMNDKAFSQYMEPILYVLSTVISMLSICPLKESMINPTSFAPFCQPSAYPEKCSIEDNPKCRGDEDDFKRFHTAFFVFVSCSFFNLMLTMGLIVLTFYQKEKDLRLSEGPEDEVKIFQHTSDRGLAHVEKLRRNVSRQALMYIGAFWLTWGGTLLTTHSELGEMYWIRALRMITQPSQGFFNLLIFFYHKVSSLRRNNQDLTIRDALKILVFEPSKTKEVLDYFSCMSMVHEHNLRLPAYERSGEDHLNDSSAPRNSGRRSSLRYKFGISSGASSLDQESMKFNIDLSCRSQSLGDFSDYATRRNSFNRRNSITTSQILRDQLDISGCALSFPLKPISCRSQSLGDFCEHATRRNSSNRRNSINSQILRDQPDISGGALFFPLKPIADAFDFSKTCQ